MMILKINDLFGAGMLCCLVLMVLVLACSDEETASGQATPTPIVTQTGTVRDTATPTATATLALTMTPTPTATPTSTVTLTPVPNAPPETFITSGPDIVTEFPITFVFRGEDPEDTADMLLFSHRIDDNNWSSWQTKTSVTYQTMPNGEHVFAVKARDSDGLEDKSPATWPFTVDVYTDQENPETWITSGPDVEIYTDTATFSYTGSDNETATPDLLFSYLLDEDGWSDFSPQTTVTFNQLSEGDHSFAVRAQDEAGNIDPTPDQVTFVVKLNYYALSLQPIGQYQYAEPDTETIFRVDIKNVGTLNGTFRFNLVPDLPPDWGAIFCLSNGQCVVGTAELEFRPGQSDFMTIHLFTPKNAPSEEQGRAKLTASCKEDPDLYEESRTLVIIY